MNSRKPSLSSSQPAPSPSFSDLNSHLPTSTATSDLKSNHSTPTSNSTSATSDLTSHQSTSATTDLTSNLDSAVPSSAPPSLTLHQDGECSRNEESESVLGDWSLPATPPIADPSFNWGPLDAQSFIDLIDKAYNDVVHWKLNLFHVPFGRAGKQFVSELARLYRAFAEGSTLECISLKAATVLTTLALQKPYRNSKAKAHSHYLERRLASWLEGDIDSLLNEGHTIQARCFKSHPKSSAKRQPNNARRFAKLMFQGKYGAASALLSKAKSSGVLGENDVLPSGETVSDVLRSKHPSAQSLNREALPPSDVTVPPLPNSVMFDSIDADAIRHAAKGTTGAAGPSGLDAHNWRRICCTFKDASDDLCHAHSSYGSLYLSSIASLSFDCF